MVTSSVRLTGDTSGLVSSFEQVGEIIDREREKIDEFSDSIRNIPNANVNGAYNNTNVINAINTQEAQNQVIQQYANGFSQNNGGISGGSGASGMARALTGGGGLTSFLMTAGPVGVGIAAVLAGVKVANNVEKKWEDRLPGILDTFNSLTSDLERNSANRNSENIRQMFDVINQRRNSDNVRFGSEDYMTTMRQLKEFGFSSWDDSLKAASNILRFENAGMGSRAQLMEVEGYAKRFGLGDALDQAYSGLINSGMTKGQFDEFLSGMQQIFEDGISKGIVKGYDEIATDLTLLENLSGGNKLWQGQYGAANLQQMNSAVGNATSLGSVNDVLMYQAISGLTEEQKKAILGEENYNADNGYINNMMILEKGITAQTIGPILRALSSTGGSQEEQIARYMNAFGLNYTKAADVYKMSQNFTEDQAEKIAANITGYKANTNAESIDSQLLESRENIANDIKQIGGTLTSINNVAVGVADAFLTKETPETKELKKLPVSGTEIDTWNKLVSSYNGPLSQEELYQNINDYFNDDVMRNWADKLNFQNTPGLKEAWNSGNGTDFFNVLFNPELFQSTAFGPMSPDDWNELSKNKNLRSLQKKNNIDTMSDFENAKGTNIETLVLQRGMLAALSEIAAFAKNGKIELVDSSY